MLKLVVFLLTVSITFESSPPQCILRRRGITIIERNLILSYHNFLRSRIALGCLAPKHPKAGNMKILHWDGALANYAQNLTNSCRYRGLQPKDPRWKTTGMNYFVVAPSEPGQTCSDWPRAIAAWWSARNNYTYHQYSPRVHAYIQLVIAEARYIGCGYSCFTQPSGKTLKLHLCLYGPSHARMAEPPYRKGKGCSGLCD